MLSVRAVLCSLLLWAGLGLSDVAFSEPLIYIEGKVLRIEGHNYFVKKKENGKEVRLRIDKNTQMSAVGIKTSDHVWATIDDQNNVKSMLLGPSAPR
ncbi:MAG TPA: hypothetical protein VIY67_04850 [Nitrospiraceae bacterium]